MAGNCFRSPWTCLGIFVAGSILIILGCSVKWAIFPVVLNKQIDENLKLDESITETWDAYVSKIKFMRKTTEQTVDVIILKRIKC